MKLFLQMASSCVATSTEIGCSELSVEPLLRAMSQGARSNLVVHFGQFLAVVLGQSFIEGNAAVTLSENDTLFKNHVEMTKLILVSQFHLESTTKIKINLVAWHVCDLGLDQPITDLGVLFLMQSLLVITVLLLC